MSLLLLIILVSGVFLVGGVTPKMHDDTLNMASTGVVEGVKSEDSAGNSFAASAGTNNESKKSLQMKQLILTTATPTPIGPTRAPTPTTTSTTRLTPSITVVRGICEDIKGPAMQIETTVMGATGGYVSLEMENGSTFETQSTIEFITSPTTYKILLIGDDGYNTKRWRLRLFSGGSKSGGIFNGGTEIASSIQSPIACYK